MKKSSSPTTTFQKLPSIFACAKSMVLTDGGFFSVVDDQVFPVPVARHGIRGTQNNNDADFRRGIGSAMNVQVTETAKLAENSRILRVKFSLRFLPLRHCIHSCIDSTGAVDAKMFRAELERFLTLASQASGLDEVARRYARNVLNGRWLWRNRKLAKSVAVSVGPILANGLEIPIDHFDNYTPQEISLGQEIADQLRGRSSNILDVVADADLGMPGVEVFPSEHFLGDKKPRGFARPLYTIGEKEIHGPGEVEARKMGQAALRDQKIGNALRTFDTWYPGFADHGLPIPVEPAGANLDENCFYRPHENGDAFSMLRSIDTIDPNSNDGMFLTAVLIRGGVFGEK